MNIVVGGARWLRGGGEISSFVNLKCMSWMKRELDNFINYFNVQDCG